MGAEQSSEDKSVQQNAASVGNLVGDGKAGQVWDTAIWTTKKIGQIDYYPRQAAGEGVRLVLKPQRLVTEYAPGVGYKSRQFVAEKSGFAGTEWGGKLGAVDSALMDADARLSEEIVGWIKRDQSTTMGALNDRVMAYIGLAERTPEQTRTFERDIQSINNIVNQATAAQSQLTSALGQARQIGDADKAIELTQKLNTVTRNLDKAKDIQSRVR